MTTVANNTLSPLRFPEFKDEWQKTSLGKFAPEIKSGLAADQNSDRLGVKVTRIETITDRSINLNRIGFVKIDRDIEDFKLLPGDILFSNINSVSHIGKVAFVDRDYDLYQGMNLLRLRTSIRNDPQFLFQKLGSVRMVRYFQRICNQAVSQASINQTDLKKTPLIVPTLPEQRKIADFLTAVDGRIGQLSQKKALLEDYKKGVMQQLFTQALRFKDDHGNDFPEWGEKTLGDIGKITTGKTPSTSDDAAWIGSTMFVTPTDIGEDTKFQRSTKRHVNGEKLRLISKHSLMFTCIASVGKMSIATEPCITNQQINSVSVNSGYFFEFIYYALRYLTPQIKATQANTTLPIINKTEFSKFLLPIPSFPEQTKIANFLTALDRKIESVSSQITGMQTWKKGLLQQMFV
jgi:type I restriction enzyme S subunit